MMTIIIVLALYISGVWVAYFQLQRWHDEELEITNEVQVLFMLSMLSWIIYPVYGVTWLINKLGGI